MCDKVSPPLVVCTVILYVTVLLSVYAHFFVLGLLISDIISVYASGCQEPVVQKIKDKQKSNEDLNLHCDLDLEHNNPIFTQDT